MTKRQRSFAAGAAWGVSFGWLTAALLNPPRWPSTPRRFRAVHRLRFPPQVGTRP